MIAPTYDGETAGARAVQVFGESLVTGYVLGGAAGFLTMCCLGVLHPDGGTGLLLVFAFFAAGIGGGVGLFVGFLAGGVLLGVVRWGEPRLGAPAVARLVPAVALGITVPVASLIGALGDASLLAGVVVLDTLLTLAGAERIAHRYLRRATRSSR
jgi:hypothetical protein